MKLIVLAAGQGTRLRPLTDDRPKCMVEAAGRPILERILEAATAAGLTEVVIVGGYRNDVLARYPATHVTNPAFETTNMVRSLFCADEQFGDGFVLTYSDIFYTPEVLTRVVESTADVAVAVDLDWREYWARRFDDVLSDAETLRIENERIVAIGGKTDAVDEIEAQYIGLMAFRGAGVERLRAAYARAEDAERNGDDPTAGRGRTVDGMYLTDLLQLMADHGDAVTPVRINGGWVEIDSTEDLTLAETLIAEGRLATGSTR